jgi:hypothetical protein
MNRLKPAQKIDTQRLMTSLGWSLMFFGTALILTIVCELYVMQTTFTLGSRILFRAYGYPWGTEQVTTNSCLLPDVSDQSNCKFLNYDELLLASIVWLVIGIFLYFLRAPAKQKSIETNLSKKFRRAFLISLGIALAVFIILQGFTAYQIGNTLYVLYFNQSWFLSQVKIAHGARIVSIPLGLSGPQSIAGISFDDVLYVSGAMSFVFATLWKYSSTSFILLKCMQSRK